jgi:acyl carrier protein
MARINAREDKKRAHPNLGDGGIPFEEFAEIVLQEFPGLSEEPSIETDLVRDLMLDSLAMYDLVVLVEGMGCWITETDLGTIRTLGDLHFLYLQGLHIQ